MKNYRITVGAGYVQTGVQGMSCFDQQHQNFDVAARSVHHAVEVAAEEIWEKAEIQKMRAVDYLEPGKNQFQQGVIRFQLVSPVSTGGEYCASVDADHMYKCKLHFRGDGGAQKLGDIISAMGQSGESVQGICVYPYGDSPHDRKIQLEGFGNDPIVFPVCSHTHANECFHLALVAMLRMRFKNTAKFSFNYRWKIDAGRIQWSEFFVVDDQDISKVGICVTIIRQTRDQHKLLVKECRSKMNDLAEQLEKFLRS
ncbi:MAG: hypothetical protein MPK09_03680 [Gammaproteobacteria bacterium]|nr:hypothetical protein [Gammaproteobacteria bacterium]